MELKLGFTTCPNDTFSFDALVNNSLSENGSEWKVELHDIEALNEKALNAEFDVVKISVALYPFIQNEYQILSAGAALGVGCGPLVIAKYKYSKKDLISKKVVLPGKYTTAHLLYSIWNPESKNKHFKVFSEIQDEVLKKQADAGVIIHENRFTYEDFGLICIKDLGAYWEELTDSPIPLGCIAIKRSLSENHKKAINKNLSASVNYALNNPEVPSSFVNQYAQEMDTEVQKQHIALYVNDFSIDLGGRGEQAILKLLDHGIELEILPEITQTEIFIK